MNKKLETHGSQVRSIHERYKDKIPGLLEIRDENVGITPLMVSVFCILLNSNTFQHNGFTRGTKSPRIRYRVLCTQHAAANGHLNVVDYLMKHGAVRLTQHSRFLLSAINSCERAETTHSQPAAETRMMLTIRGFGAAGNGAGPHQRDRNAPRCPRGPIRSVRPPVQGRA